MFMVKVAGRAISLDTLGHEQALSLGVLAVFLATVVERKCRWIRETVCYVAQCGDWSFSTHRLQTPPKSSRRLPPKSVRSL